MRRALAWYAPAAERFRDSFGGKMFRQKIKLAFALFSLTATSFGGPGLTTISDVLYRVDGTPFEGSATIVGVALNAGSAASVGMPVKTRIRHGKLKVRLVNRAEGLAYYSVKYDAGKTGEFVETWAVPARPGPFGVKDVLVAATGQMQRDVRAAAVQPGAAQPDTATIPESSVIGLVSDLAARPVKGISFGPGLAAVIDSTGAIGGASGSFSNCVQVDGSSGPCGLSPTFVDEQVPSGVVNGSNTAFTTSASAAPQTSLALYRNGVLQKAGEDYTLSGNAVTFLALSVPQVGDTLLATYRGAPTAGANNAVGAQVLCSSTGGTTSSTTLTTLGSCTMPAGTLQPGDRVRIDFDYYHQNATAGFNFTVSWGSTLLLLRAAGASERFVYGWAEAGIDATGSQLSVQSWGTILVAATGVMNTSESFAAPIVLTFQGDMAATTTDTLALRNFSVVLYPRVL
jgi:hypothetical protein